jgi:hypothetical protein
MKRSVREEIEITVLSSFVFFKKTRLGSDGITALSVRTDAGRAISLCHPLGARRQNPRMMRRRMDDAIFKDLTRVRSVCQ